MLGILLHLLGLQHVLMPYLQVYKVNSGREGCEAMEEGNLDVQKNNLLASVQRRAERKINFYTLWG